VGPPEHGDEVGRSAELGEQIGGGADAAAKDLFLEIARRDDVFLRWLAQRLDVNIFVEDGVADDETAFICQRVERRGEIIDGDSPAQCVEELVGLFRIDLQREVGEIR